MNKHYCLLIFVVITFVSCLPQKEIAKFDRNLVLSEINIDEILFELNNRNIDSMLVYEIGCSGCIVDNREIYFVFFKEKNVVKCKRVTSYEVSREEICGDVFTPFFLKEKEIIEDKNHLVPYSSHYWYKKVSVFEKRNLLFEGQVYNPTKKNERDNKFIELISLLDSELMWIIWNNDLLR